MINVLILVQVWKDPFLHWRPSDYSGLERITVSTASVWMPELVLVNSYVRSLVYTNFDWLRNLTGKIVWSPGGLLNVIRIECCHFTEPG